MLKQEKVLELLRHYFQLWMNNMFGALINTSGIMMVYMGLNGIAVCVFMFMKEHGETMLAE